MKTHSGARPRRGLRLAAALATTALALTGLGFVAPAAHAVDAAPSNDDLANAITLSGALPIRTTGTLVGATQEEGEVGNGDTVWYSWTAPSAQAVEVSLAGSQFDTYLGVYSGDADLADVADLDVVNTNDDAYNYQSAVDFEAVAGETYYVQVDLCCGDPAPFHLALTAAPTVLRGTVALPDDADPGTGRVDINGLEITNAIDATGHYELPLTINGDRNFDITYGYYDRGESFHSADVTQSIVAGTVTVVDVDLTTDPIGVEVTDPAEVNWGAQFGNPVQLNAALPIYAVGNNSNGGDPEAGEAALGEYDDSVWYTWTPSSSALVSIQASGDWQSLGVYTGDAIGDLDEVASGATGTALFNAIAGTTYHLMIADGGDSDDAGLFQLTVERLSAHNGIQGTVTRNDGGAGTCVHVENDSTSLEVTADADGHYSAVLPSGAYTVQAYVCGHGNDYTSSSADVAVDSGFVTQDLRLNIFAPARLDRGVIRSSDVDFGTGGTLPHAVLESIQINASAIGYPDLVPDVVIRTVDGVSGFLFSGAYDPSLLLSGTVSGTFLVDGDETRDFSVSTGDIDPSQFVLGADYRVVVDLDSDTVSFEQVADVANPPATTSVALTADGATSGSFTPGASVPLSATVDTSAEILRGTLLLTDNGAVIGEPLPIGHEGDPATNSRTVSWTVPNTPGSHVLAAIFTPDLDSYTVGSRRSIAVTVSSAGPGAGSGGSGGDGGTPTPTPTPTPSPSGTPKPTPSPSASPTTEPQPTSDVTGKPRPGKTLTATIDDLPEGATVSYQWFVGGKKVKHGGKRKGYTVKNGDQGHPVKVRITIEVPGRQPTVTIVRVGRVR